MAQGAKHATMKSKSAEAKATDAMKTTAATKAMQAMKRSAWRWRRLEKKPKAARGSKKSTKSMKAMNPAKKSTRAEHKAEEDHSGRNIFYLLALEGEVFGCGF